MKKNFKKLVVLGLSCGSLLSITSCGSKFKGISSKADAPDVICETKVGDEIIGTALDVGTYKSLDEDKALELLKNKFGKNMAKGGCTAVLKDRSESGQGVLIGRNMDLSLSDKPLYKFELDYNKYKAMGIAYSPYSGPNVEQAKSGFLSNSEEGNLYAQFLPTTGSDYLNEKGLYMEVNMRNLDYGLDPVNDFHNSKFGCTGTNPGKGLPDVFLSAVPFYTITRCATVPEVLDFMRNKINIYNAITTKEEYATNKAFGTDWNFCFACADALGNNGLIEVAKNKVFFTPRIGQANFYREETLAREEVYKTGGWPGCEVVENTTGAALDGVKSRFAVAMENLDNVNSAFDMQENMRKVLYSQAYANENMGVNAAINKYSCSHFNPRYEMVQCFPLVPDTTVADEEDQWKLDFENGSVFACTFERLINMSSSKFNELFKQYTEHHYKGKNKKTLLEQGEDYWLTTQSVVTDIDNRTWSVSFFEGSEVFEFSI